ncbi:MULTISPECIES: type II toxin-antitoxin system prevent-host-death family antitoxin [Nitrospirillum]|uniref:Antitoxin n=1 Tax=Nitrospirillum amazonense TaxID=28077 RepID=A0A560G6R2_9PROT|nr:type II toxin-antitoxin system prevent-host-death family antitoxin [Nitrospirillum amazonense]MEC4593143.1 type II toxin-antitoxin system prevent-host-death family antitoxin [Nitrospirillum amazonense]TWB29593.1 prevent-host-death family protein [Nitrospirillum amazonense]
MRRFSSLDLQRNVAQVQEAALREPVTVSYHGRDRLVILSVDEFERLKQRDKMVISMEEMPEEFLRALQEPYYDADQAALDHLMDE